MYLYIYAPLSVVPLWDATGRADRGVVGGTAAPGQDAVCTTSQRTRCAVVAYDPGRFPYARAGADPGSWQGTLVVDKADATGTYYRRNRSYDPQTARWTQEDPAGLAGGLNLYGFAGGDPTNYSDPFGLCPECAVALAGVGAGEETIPLVGQVLGTATLAVAGVWLAYNALTRDRADATPMARSTREDVRGVTVRLQAQGGGLEQSVVVQSGAGGVVTGADALHALALLQSSLSSKDAAARARSFVKAAAFIQSAAAGGGTGYVKKPFPAGPGTDVRVDVEVLRGHAFTPGSRSDALIIPPR